MANACSNSPQSTGISGEVHFFFPQLTLHLCKKSFKSLKMVIKRDGKQKNLPGHLKQLFRSV